MILKEPYLIRFAQYNDIDRILDIMAEVTAHLPFPSWYVADDREFLARHIDKDGFTLVAVKNESIVAFLVVRFPGAKEDNLGSVLDPLDVTHMSVAHMESTAVIPAEQGKGLQLRLLREAEMCPAIKRYAHWMATVHPDNHYSLANFQCLGYREIARIPKYGGLNRIILHKDNPY